jgi:hypothetical protein
MFVGAENDGGLSRRSAVGGTNETDKTDITVTPCQSQAYVSMQTACDARSRIHDTLQTGEKDHAHQLFKDPLVRAVGTAPDGALW